MSFTAGINVVIYSIMRLVCLPFIKRLPVDWTLSTEQLQSVEEAIKNDSFDDLNSTGLRAIDSVIPLSEEDKRILSSTIERLSPYEIFRYVTKLDPNDKAFDSVICCVNLKLSLRDGVGIENKKRIEQIAKDGLEKGFSSIMGTYWINHLGRESVYAAVRKAQQRLTLTPVKFEQLPREFHDLVTKFLNKSQLTQMSRLVEMHPDIVQAWLDQNWIREMSKHQDRMFIAALSYQLNKLGLTLDSKEDAEIAYTLSLALMPGPPTSQDHNYDAHCRLAFLLFRVGGDNQRAKMHAIQAIEQYRLSGLNNSTAAHKLDDSMRRSFQEMERKDAAEYEPLLRRLHLIARDTF